MILDGNSFSSRLPVFLSSGSLLFRAGLFAEWFDERIQPMKHYLPVRSSMSPVHLLSGLPSTCTSVLNSDWSGAQRFQQLPLRSRSADPYSTSQACRS